MLRDLTQVAPPRPIPFLVYPVAAFEILRAMLMFWVVIAPLHGQTTHVIPYSWIQVSTLNPLFSLEPDRPDTFLFYSRYHVVESADPRTNALIGVPLGAFALFAGIGLMFRSSRATAAAAVTSFLTILFWMRVAFYQSVFPYHSVVVANVRQILFVSDQAKSNFHLALLLNLIIFCYLSGEPVAHAFMPRPTGPRRNF
jgi:hypothetical protein